MKFVLGILGCTAAAFSALGQGFSVQVVLEQDTYLAGETLPVKVRVSNFSGQLLHLGKEADWLTFNIENAERTGVGRLSQVPVGGEFELESAMTGTKKVNLAPYFELTRSGRYFVTASVNVPELQQTLSSKPVTFDIIKGSSIWEQDFGVPGTAAEGRPPEIRRYALVQTLHSKTIMLYVRLTDPLQNRIFNVFPLGTLVSFSHPEPQLDRFGNLHVLYQTSARLYVHCLVNPDGVVIARETYDLTATRPTMRPENDGRITVTGGARRMMATDLPPPVTSTNAHAKLDRP